jgi:anti-sigma factor RsiW
MSCHKVSRTLLERFRFGELDAGCDELLAHVERCRPCQDEIAVDRALATHLRLALRRRVDGFEPSPAVWRAVRLQASDPEPPGPWWATAVLSLARGMRVAVPAAAVMLAAVLTFSWSDDRASLTSPFASRLQWEERLTTIQEVDDLTRPIHRTTPSPSIHLPLPNGEMAYPELVQSVKLPTGIPSTGGVIR